VSRLTATTSDRADMTANPTAPEPRAPQPLQLAPASSDTGPPHQRRPISPLKEYIVRAELDKAADTHQQNDIVELLAGHRVRVSRSPEGRTAIQLVLSGRDLWQSVLDAMVTLTNARCAPTALSVVEAGRDDRPRGPDAPCN
jgi:hypothetical protein